MSSSASAIPARHAHAISLRIEPSQSPQKLIVREPQGSTLLTSFRNIQKNVKMISPQRCLPLPETGFRQLPFRWHQQTTSFDRITFMNGPQPAVRLEATRLPVNCLTFVMRMCVCLRNVVIEA
jgi:hypothetical protein